MERERIPELRSRPGRPPIGAHLDPIDRTPSGPRTTAQDVIDNATLTPLQARFKRLPLSDALEVWDMALPREKDELIKELRKKRQAYVKTHHAAERAQDPKWAKLQRIFGQ